MKLVDLTLPISPSLPSFPGSPGPQFLPWSDLEKRGYNLEMLFLSSHTGTHIDAPSHFAKGGMTVDQIPLDRLSGIAPMIRIRAHANHSITKSMITSFEDGYGRISSGSNIFLYTGWQQRLKKKNYFTDNPGLSADAARYLVSKKINMVCTDSPSIDPGNDSSFSAHRILARAGVLIVENLANLDQVKGTNIEFMVLPLRLKGASGSPVRAFGMGVNTWRQAKP